MADDVPPMPDEDTSVPPDPFEAELVAYLDGELDPAAARRVEARLAADPAARAKAAALKKTFDLLDYLPKPDPSPNFTTKTLDKLPAMKSGTPARPQAAQSPSPSSVSSSTPMALATESVPVPPARSGWGFWAAGVLVAVTACAGTGYFVASALRPPHAPPGPVTPDDLPISDRGVVENLPLYAAADDLEFVRELAAAEFFGDDPVVSFDTKLKPPQPVESDSPSAEAFDALARSFKALPQQRQQAVRELDKQLRELPDRDRLFRVLEAYTAWLDRLPPPERKQVLAAEDAKARLEEVRNLRNEQWVGALPVPQRAELRKLPVQEKAARILELRKVEAERREHWDFVREHAEDIAANRVPWPFDDPARKRDVIEFVRVTFHTDESKKSRLTANEFDGLKKALAEANEKQGWAWHAYGKLAHDLTRKYEVLPEPATGEPVTRPDQLPKQFERFFDKGPGAKAIQDKVGKWPDFALEVHRFMQFPKAGALPPLGPAKPGEFKEPLRAFVIRELGKALTFPERQRLEGLEGRWPEYPREVVRLAKLHNLSAPSLMLPGPPRQWDAVYRTSFRPGRGFTPRP